MADPRSSDEYLVQALTTTMLALSCAVPWQCPTKTHMPTTNCSRCTTNLARHMLSVLRFDALLIYSKHVHAASCRRQSSAPATCCSLEHQLPATWHCCCSCCDWSCNLINNNMSTNNNNTININMINKHEMQQHYQQQHELTATA